MARARTIAVSIGIAALLVAATVLVFASFTNLRSLAGVLARGSWPWITAGVIAHVAFFAGYAYLYRLGFAIVGVASRTRSLIPVVFAGLFVNVIVPTGAGAAALFLDDAARRGESAAHAAIGVVLVLVLDLVTLVPFVAWGVYFLARDHHLAAWQLAGTAVFAAYLVVLVLLLAVSRRRERLVQRALVRLRDLADRVRRLFHVHAPLSEEWPARTAERFAAAAGAICERPRRLAGAALWATGLHVLNAAGLWMFARGFGLHVPLGGLVAAFALGIVFFVIVVVPQGAPVVEAMMAATLIRVGVPRAGASAATLAFRGVNFWLPLGLGLLFAWRLGTFGARPGREEAA